MDIDLHLGAHRCGSTTLQRYLDRNAAALARAGLEIWTPGRTRGGLFSGLLQCPRRVTLDGERRGARATGLIRLEAARLARAGARQLLVSDENMIGAIRDNLRAGQLYPLAHERLLRFRNGFADCRRIGIAIRGYDGYWASSLAYAVAAGHRMPDRETLDRLVTQPRRWRHLVADVVRVFPSAQITVWSFEALAGRPEAQLDLLTGDSCAALRLVGARDWRNAAPRRDALRRMLAQRGDAAGAAALPPGDDRWMPFDAAQRAKLRADYRVDLAWLASGAQGLARLAGPMPVPPRFTKRPPSPDGHAAA